MVAQAPSSTVARDAPALSTSPSDRQPQPSLSVGTRDFVAGIISGFGKLFAGHPFDTVKARVQSGRFNNSWQALRGTVQQEGVTALYQGMCAPMVTVCFVGGVLFYFNGKIRSLVQPDPKAQLTYWQMFVAGGGAGLVVGVVVTPPEVIKLHLQVANKKANAAPHEAPLTVRGVIRKVGLSNLWCGSSPTLIREVGTFGLFFPINEFFKKLLMERKDGLRYGIDKAPMITRITAAGMGGILAWLPCYPIDQIKSKMQLSKRGTYRSMWHCAVEIHASEGLRKGFFKGLTPCLSRAFPAYAAQYLLYEYAASCLKQL